MRTPLLVGLVLLVPSPVFPQTPPLEVLYTGVPGTPASVLPGLAGNIWGETLSILQRGGITFLCASTDQGEWGVLRDGVLIAQTGLFVDGHEIVYLTLLDALPDGTFLADVTVDNGALSSYHGIALFPVGQPPVWIAEGGTPCSFVPALNWYTNGAFYGGGLTDTGQVIGFGLIGTYGSGNNERLTFRDGDLLALTRVTVPTPLPGDTPSPWADLGLAATTDDGSYALLGRLEDGRRAFAVDGQVRSVEGTSVGGFPIAHPWGTLGPDGAWWGYSVAPNGNDGVVHLEGQPLTWSGQPVVPGSSDLWLTFSSPLVTSPHRYVLRGKRDTGLFGEYIHVSDHGTLLIEPGMPLDLDGNGLMDDDAFVDNGIYANPGHLQFLDPDGNLYALVYTRNGAGHTYPHGATLVRANLSDHELGTRVCDAVPNSTGGAARSAVTGTEGATQGETWLHAFPVPPGKPALFFYSATTAQQPFGPGYLCASGPATRLGVVEAGPTGLVSTELDKALVGAAGPIQPGTRMTFQCWYRDPAGLPLHGFSWNTSDATEILFTP